MTLLAHGIVPLVFLVWLVGRGEARSIEVRDRERRTAPYLFGAACVTLFALVLAVWLPPQRQALAWIECAQAVNTLVLMGFFLPFSYFMDSMMWRSFQRRAGQAGDLPAYALGGQKCRRRKGLWSASSSEGVRPDCWNQREPSNIGIAREYPAVPWDPWSAS